MANNHVAFTSEYRVISGENVDFGKPAQGPESFGKSRIIILIATQTYLI
jgi:hypothetical protein